MWAQFLEKVSLIDSVQVSDTKSLNGTRKATVNTLQLGQLRPQNARIAGEKLEVKWFLDNIEQIQFRDVFTIDATPGVWLVQVHFVTSEVRNDPRDLLTSSEIVVVSAE